MARDIRIADRLRRAPPIVRSTYSDRYLKSPLTTQLLHSLLTMLDEFPGGTNADTRITLVTEPVQRDATRNPSQVFHDWRDGRVRRELWENLFSDLGRFELEERPKAKLPHARTLTLTWDDGTTWALRMDQGVDYWRLRRGEDGGFPFDGGTEHQIESLREANLIVEGDTSGHPTYWYCEQGH